MELALGAMAGLAPKLGDLLMAEYVVQKGLKPDIVSLSDELVMMHASLVDASRIPPDQLTEVQKLWARKVRELSFDTEDAVDDFVLRVACGNSAAADTDANVFKKILGKATAPMKKFKDRRQISDRVKDIKKLSNELAELRDKYTVRGAGADLAASTGIDPRVINLYQKESDLVGIEESRDKLIRMLSIGTKDDDAIQRLKIVSVVGVGGLGKTTLAKTVHDMLKKQFSCSAFISVGRTPNLNRTFEKMLVELDHQKYSQVDMARWDAEQFSNELRKFLEDKRYFVVVDDIWDKGSWEAIRYALKDNSCGSRIIMTTRNSEVVTKAEELYLQKHLSDENSKKLFYKRIQCEEGESLDVSGELSRKIINKCCGIPLAIIAIASLLVERPREEWSKIYDSIGFGNGDNTTRILAYSYYDLPSYLKPCLLHLSIFGEDYVLETKSIIWMWIGEGFVHLEKEEGSLFEAGERYFNELVNRSMIQPMGYSDNPLAQHFRIHDIVFDLINKLSRDENFVTFLGSKEQHASPDRLRREKKTSMPHSDSKVRRLAVRDHHVQRFPEDTMDMPKMDRQWMYNADRRSKEFIDGLHYFLSVAEANKQNGFMCCPCVHCNNNKDYSSSRILHSHIFANGFMKKYVCWTKHGEQGVTMEDNEEEDFDDHFPGNAGIGAFDDDIPMEEPEVDVAENDPSDDLGQALHNVQADCESETERLKFQKLLEDHHKLLYPDCQNGFKKLGTTLELLQWKATNGVSDKGFGELLKLVKKMLPKDNELPATTYEAKQLVCPLGLEVQKIHACPNDCILYRGEYENLDACPVCSALRYKIRKDDPGDVEGEPPRKRVPAKVMWYLPIIPRLKRLFRNKDNAKLMRWHKEERKKDSMLRHPADGSQWRKIDRTYPEFDLDARNIRFGLSTDGMNPFGEMSSGHSTWPVTLCLYNLPPWLCMKRKFIMMPVLIPGPKQPGNDIDVYLRPLVKELLFLWGDEGVRMWDEYKQENFNLRALLFVTINDWPALSNLSGHSNKGYKACTHCLDDTDNIWLTHCKKVVYMGHRRFLPIRHAVRKKGKHFKGQADHRTKPMHRSGKDVFNMVKDLEVVFGKGSGSQPVPNENGMAPMWKKKSIFWELPYWEVLDVRHAIDVMHLTKNFCVNLIAFLGVYGKTKDTVEARQELQRMEERDALHPQQRDNGRQYLSPASYTLSKEEKETMFDCLSSIKVPSGYSSNIKGILNLAEKKFTNLKSHDCHVLMTELLPVVLRGILPDNVRLTIVKICAFLNAVSQKIIDPENLIKLQNDVVQCLVGFELIFPPSFFNIMTHLLVHLVKEIDILGPVFLHNMFPFERFMGVLKKCVRNRARPEGSIASAYGTEEVIDFCVDFIDDLKLIGVPESRYEG